MLYLIVFIINVCLALWVQHDASNLRSRGVSVIPGIWSTFVFFGSVYLFLIYIIVRIFIYGPKSKMELQPLPKAASWTNWLVVILLVVVVGGILLTIMVFSSMSRARSAAVNTNTSAPSQASNANLSEPVSVNSTSTSESKISQNNNEQVKVTLPIISSSHRAGDTISVEWTPVNFPVVEIAIIPEKIEKADGTFKAVWSGYGGEMEKGSPITTGKYNFVIPKEIPSDIYKIRIISDYSNSEKTSYFSGPFTILNPGK